MADSLSRDSTAFETLVPGRVALGGFYDGWRRFRAALRGERFRAEHASERVRP